MSLCNHEVETHKSHTGAKFVLVHHDESILIAAGLMENQTSSCHEIEEFATAQDLVDQADAYSIDLPLKFYIKYLELEHTFDQQVIDDLIDDVWASGDAELIRRMEALGHEEP